MSAFAFFFDHCRSVLGNVNVKCELHHHLLPLAKRFGRVEGGGGSTCQKNCCWCTVLSFSWKLFLREGFITWMGDLMFCRLTFGAFHEVGGLLVLFFVVRRARCWLVGHFICNFAKTDYACIIFAKKLNVLLVNRLFDYVTKGSHSVQSKILYRLNFKLSLVNLFVVAHLYGLSTRNVF